MIHVKIDYQNLTRFTGLALQDVDQAIYDHFVDDEFERELSISLYSPKLDNQEAISVVENACTEYQWICKILPFDSLLTAICVDTIKIAVDAKPNDTFLFFSNTYGLIPLYDFLKTLDINFTICADILGNKFKKYNYKVINGSKPRPNQTLSKTSV
jgi:hypothetical protein